MRRRDDERMIVASVVHEYLALEGELAYKPTSREDGKPEWGVFLVWSDGYERAVYNGRTGEPKRFRLADSLIKFHQSIHPDATSITIGLKPVDGAPAHLDADDD